MNGLCYLPKIVVEGLLVMLDEECFQFQGGHRANILNRFDSILKQSSENWCTPCRI